MSLGWITSCSQSVASSSSLHAVPQSCSSDKTASAGELLAWRCHFTRTVWLGLLAYLFWEFSSHLDANSWPRRMQEAVAESWQGVAACWIVAGLRSGWHHPKNLSWSQVTVCPLFVPHSSSGNVHLAFFWLLCNCQNCFFSPSLLVFLVRHIVPVRRYYWRY